MIKFGIVMSLGLCLCETYAHDVLLLNLLLIGTVICICICLSVNHSYVKFVVESCFEIETHANLVFYC